VGVEVLITDTDAHPACPACREAREPADTDGVSIGANCFLGARSIILKGVTLADGTCVGAGSVVSRSAAPLAGIVGGNPARQLRPTAACPAHLKRTSSGEAGRA
jgi:acetyltransferase-like isoleucine patch superfamily enzyme